MTTQPSSIFQPCFSPLATLAILAIVVVPSLPATAVETIRVGIIGCDTSHVPAFTGLLNKNPQTDQALKGVRVVAAYPGGSQDIPSSRDRVGKYTEQLRGMGIEIVDSIDSLLERVDAVLLESVDGRKHLPQVRPVLAAGRPVFIDKPLAGTLADAVEILDLARRTKTPFFSSSALRFTPAIYAARTSKQLGQVLGCAAYSPCALEPTHPDLFWYGVHGVETLYTIMGTGCERVTRAHTKDTDLVTGIWKDGRIGTFRGTRSGPHGYGALVFGKKSDQVINRFGGYEPLVRQIVKFFKTGQPPVATAETLEIFAFMEAADASKRQGGVPVTLESVLSKAQAEVAARR